MPVLPSDKNVKAESAEERVKNSYAIYGKYANSTRAAVGIDGLKSVQRRTLLAVRDEASKEFVGSAKVVGRCISAYHPHAESYPVLVKMVRNGYVEGYGNFGASMLEELEAAAMRYTKVKAHAAFQSSLFRLIDQVPVYENEFGIDEPKYLPVPIPLCLTTSDIGIGIGMYASYPAFNPVSILKALEEDSYEHLRAPHGLTIDKENLQSLWEMGQGFIQYRMRCFQEASKIDEKTVSVIEGSGKLFKPPVYRIFSGELAEESVYIRDESESEKHIRVIVGRVKGIKRISDDDIYTKAISCSSKVFNYRLYVSYEDTVKRISLRDWLNECWGKYNDSVDSWKSESLKRLNSQKEIVTLIPKVYPLLVKGASVEDIAKTHSTTVEAIQSVESKPLRMLRRSNFSEEIKSLDDKIAEVQSTTAKKLARSFVQILEKSQS